MRRGFALLRLARADEALADFAAAARAGGDVDATLGRALALEALHRNDEAVAALRDFLKRAPTTTSGWRRRARIWSGWRGNVSNACVAVRVPLHAAWRRGPVRRSAVPALGAVAAPL